MKLLILHPFPLIRTTLSCPGEEVHTQEGDDSDSDKAQGQSYRFTGDGGNKPGKVSSLCQQFKADDLSPVISMSCQNMRMPQLYWNVLLKTWGSSELFPSILLKMEIPFNLERSSPNISILSRMWTRKTRGKFSWIVDYQQGRRFTLGRERKIKCLIFIWNICWPPGLLEIRTKMTFFVTNLMRHVLIMFDTRVTQAAPASAGGPQSPARTTRLRPDINCLILSD